MPIEGIEQFQSLIYNFLECETGFCKLHIVSKNVEFNHLHIQVLTIYHS